MAGIEKGGAAAHAVWSLIDPGAVERTPISSLPDDVATDVVRTLMIITRSIMRAMATSAEVSYRDLRAKVWQQLAAMPRDNDASESVRVLLTAWDEPELANLVTADMFSNADPADIAVEFAFLVNILASGFTRLIGGPPPYYKKIRAWLGV